MLTTVDNAAAADQIRIESATIEDLPELTDLVVSLLAMEADFRPDAQKQRHGLQLILEQPSRGRIFVLRNDYKVIGMVNLLFTISTAEGGFVLLMEDVIIRREHRGHGYGTRLVDHVKEFAAKKDFKRITLLTDRVSAESQRFFERNGFVLSHMVPMRLLLKGEMSPFQPASGS
ncbi:MAG: GCN5-related N-acetyltransferase [Verrucomicrobiales bacterium]|nr:GCN5-related N-acetyltransferase [Verrucomicrobiales bacterium]